MSLEAPARPNRSRGIFWCRAATTLRQGARVIEDSPAQAAVTHRPEGRLAS